MPRRTPHGAGQIPPHFAEYVRQLPELPPREADRELEARGYRGQELARRTLCLVAYRHVRRLKRLHLEGLDRRDLPPKTNVLLLGPTGSGKTYLVELLFGQVLKLPTVVVDMTTFSETGYVGDDTRTILTRLLLAAAGDPAIASTGIACLDEFDKLAGSQNNGRFDGQGTTKDVSGFGVQRELLRLLEGVNVDVPLDFNNTSYSARQPMHSGDITFVAAGAFSGLNLTAAASRLYAGGRLGFDAGDYEKPDNAIAFTISPGQAEDVALFQAYGFLPELIGRFGRVIPLAPLDRPTLRAILQDNVIAPFVAEFASEGLDLVIDERVVTQVVDEAYARQTGARGLASALTGHLEQAAFDWFCGPPGRVRLHHDGERVVAERT